MKKRRHIRWDRLFLVAFLTLGVLFSVGFGIYKLIDKLTAPKVIAVEPPIILETKYTPSIAEFNEMMIEKYQQEQEEFDNLVDLGEFRLTGYCNCEICCGQWAGGPCYNGEMPEAEWTIAVDPDIIPINSYVLINGHKYKACDTGSAINGYHIDIYCSSHEECYSDFCNGYAEVYLINE